MSKNNKASKINNLKQVVNSLDPKRERRDLEKVALSLISPSQTEPLVFPALVPGRAGAAKFPMVIETAGDTDFGIRVEPSFSTPLMISHGSAIPESNTPYVFEGTIVPNSTTAGVCKYLQGLRQCFVGSETVGGLQALPISSAAGATITMTLTYTEGEVPLIFELQFFDGSTWSPPANADVSIRAGATDTTANIRLPDTATHFTITTSPASGVPANINGGGTFTGVLGFIAGTATCASDDNEHVMDVQTPDWFTLLAQCDRARIVAIEVLVTFMGSSLNNQGAIAVCNSDESLSMVGNLYDTIASRPVDKYQGRLASTGEQEGGAHWHYLPDSVETLEMLPVGADYYSNDMVGYFGIKGKAADQPIKIDCTFVVNYYSTDTTFSSLMRFQPSFSDYSHLISELRIHVPLVSSNDSHLEKALKYARHAASKGVGYALANPQRVMEALALVATLL